MLSNSKTTSDLTLSANKERKRTVQLTAGLLKGKAEELEKFIEESAMNESEVEMSDAPSRSGILTNALHYEVRLMRRHFNKLRQYIMERQRH